MNLRNIFESNKYGYLVERLVLDPMENNSYNAVRWDYHGVCNSEKKVIEFCKTGQQFTNKDCWAIPKGMIMNEYKYTKVKRI